MISVLIFTHRPARGNIDRLEQLKEEAATLKETVVKNLIDNVHVNGTIFEFASAFDFHRKIDLEQHLKYIEKLGSIYCIDYVHNF